jgi:hypothetical protein
MPSVLETDRGVGRDIHRAELGGSAERSRARIAAGRVEPAPQLGGPELDEHRGALGRCGEQLENGFEMGNRLVVGGRAEGLGRDAAAVVRALSIGPSGTAAV